VGPGPTFGGQHSRQHCCDDLSAFDSLRAAIGTSKSARTRARKFRRGEARG